MTSDFYEIVEHGVVGEVNQGTVVQSVEDLGAASPYAKDVHFGSATGPTPSTDTPGQISSKPLATVYLVTPDLNLGADAAKFFDTSLDYVIKTDSFGKFDLGVSATIYNSFLIQGVPSENYYQYAGTVSTNGAIVVGVGGTIPRWKTYTSLEWSLHGFDAVVGQTFIPHVYDIGTGGSSESAPLHVPSYDQYDFALGYDFGRAKVGGQFLQGLSIRIGVNNAFDYMPPVAPYDLQESLADVGSYNGAVGGCGSPTSSTSSDPETDFCPISLGAPARGRLFAGCRPRSDGRSSFLEMHPCRLRLAVLLAQVAVGLHRQRPAIGMPQPPRHRGNVHPALDAPGGEQMAQAMVVQLRHPGRGAAARAPRQLPTRRIGADGGSCPRRRRISAKRALKSGKSGISRRLVSVFVPATARRFLAALTSPQRRAVPSRRRTPE